MRRPANSVLTGQNCEAGFSLIELIVSLTLLAMILMVLPGAFRTGHRGWETAALIEQRAASDASLEFLRHRLAEASPRFETDESGRAGISFSGRPDQMTFVAPASSGPAGGGLYRFTVKAVPSARSGASDLVVVMQPFRPNDSGGGASNYEHRLASGVAAFGLRYFGSPVAGDAPVWSDAWARTDRLPDLVELSAPTGKSGGNSPLRIELKLRPAI
jgi:general secretion pathway protein J